MAKKKPTDTTPEDDRAAGEAVRWKAEIRLYEREAEKWVTRGKKIISRYKDERKGPDQRNRFNVLWSNVQTLIPALFAKNPIVNVERRFQSDDDTGRFASEVLERCSSFFVDDKYFHAVSETVLDRLLPGRGTIWVRYLPTFTDEQTEPSVSDDTPVGDLVSEETVIDYVNWLDFGCSWGRTWEEVNLVWRKVYMDRPALIKRFGQKIGKKIPLDHAPEKLNDEKILEAVKKATIYEGWDKLNKKAVWLHKDWPTPLDEKDDPLKLKEFFPCPRPLFATMANDSIIPVPDYAEYQDQAEELDEVTARISLLVKAVKVAGVYASDAEAVQRLLSEGLENILVPVESWAMFAEKGGLKGIIEYLPLDEIMKAIVALYEIREKIKNDLYEVSGLADIIRGNGDPNETATGVKTKSQFATLRLNSMQSEVSRFNRDVVRIMAEIIATHFSLDTIKQLSGVELLTGQEKQMLQMVIQMQQQAQPQPGQPPMPPPQLPPNLQKLMGDPEKLAEAMDNPTWEEVHELLKNDTMRAFRIDIEVNSTIKMDQDKERQDRIDFLQAAGGFIQQAVTVENPALQPVLFEMLMFGIRGFHVGKDLESAFKVAQKKIEQEAENPNPKPDPEMQKNQMLQQLEQQKMAMQQQHSQNELQQTQAQSQKDAQFESARMQADQQIEFTKISHNRDLEQMKMQHEGLKLTLQQEIEHAKIQSAERMKAAELQHQKEIEGAKMQNQNTVEGAKIKSTEKLARVKAKAGPAAEMQTDNLGVEDDEEGPTKLDAMGDKQQQTLDALEKQMQTLLKLAEMQQHTMQTVQHAVTAITAPKKVVRDEKGRISGVTSA